MRILAMHGSRDLVIMTDVLRHSEAHTEASARRLSNQMTPAMVDVPRSYCVNQLKLEFSEYGRSESIQLSQCKMHTQTHPIAPSERHEVALQYRDFFLRT